MAVGVGGAVGGGVLGVEGWFVVWRARTGWGV